MEFVKGISVINSGSISDVNYDGLMRGLILGVRDRENQEKRRSRRTSERSVGAKSWAVRVVCGSEQQISCKAPKEHFRPTPIFGAYVRR